MSKKNNILQVTVFITFLTTSSVLPAAHSNSAKSCYDEYIALNTQGSTSRRVLCRAVEIAKKNKFNSLDTKTPCQP